MKKMRFILAMFMILVVSGTAAAFDLDALDRVNVLMTKDKVIALLGKPDQIDEVRDSLKVEIYITRNMNPMVTTGCIYDGQRLAGQAFVFQGDVGKEAAERLKKLGFAVTEEKEGTFRLIGRDDDTGQPLIVHILPSQGMTVVMTFEKDFYDRKVK